MERGGWRPTLSERDSVLIAVDAGYAIAQFRQSAGMAPRPATKVEDPAEFVCRQARLDRRYVQVRVLTRERLEKGGEPLRRIYIRLRKRPRVTHGPMLG